MMDENKDNVNRDYNELNDLDESVEFTNEISDVIVAIIREGISIMLYVCGTIIFAFFTGLIINDTALLRWLIESISITCVFTLFTWVLFCMGNDFTDLFYSEFFSFINNLLSLMRFIMFIVMRYIDLIKVHTQWFYCLRSCLLIYCKNYNHPLIPHNSFSTLQGNKW
jgi:hypothetical protein